MPLKTVPKHNRSEGSHALKANYFLLTWDSLTYTMAPAHTNCPSLQHAPEPILTEPNCRCRKLSAHTGNFLIAEGYVCLFEEECRKELQ